MNFSAFVGYWFAGAANGEQRASLFASYGLNEDVPAHVTPSFIKRVGYWFWEFFE